MSEEPPCFGLVHVVQTWTPSIKAYEEKLSPCLAPSNCSHCNSGNERKRMFDSNDIECTGGYDPGYTDAMDRIRPRCAVYDACRHKITVQSAQIEEAKRRQYLPQYRPTTSAVPIAQAATAGRTTVTPPSASGSPYIQTHHSNNMAVRQPAMTVVQDHLHVPSILEAVEPDALEDGTKVPIVKRVLVDGIRAALTAVGVQTAKSISSKPWIK